jgi:hypothetical protein
VRYRDRTLLDGEEQFGIIEPLLTIQERIDETVFGMLLAQYYAAFKQRYVIGWIPEGEQKPCEASASALWTFDDANGEGRGADRDGPDALHRREGLGEADMAAIAQVPGCAGSAGHQQRVRRGHGRARDRQGPQGG